MNTKYTKMMALLLGVGMIGAAGAAAAQQYGPPPPPQGQYGGPQNGGPGRGGPGGWDAPPPEMRDFMRRGYADGVQGAQRDFENHRIWNVNNRDEFRHPQVPRNVRGDYREGFKRGYYATVRHFQGGRGPGGPR